MWFLVALLRGSCLWSMGKVVEGFLAGCEGEEEVFVIYCERLKVCRDF